MYPILSDIDGTLIDSSKVEAWSWSVWADQHRLDPEPFIAAHGLRIQEKLARFAPHLHSQTEENRLITITAECPLQLRAYPGAAELLATTPSLALVTSGLRAVSLPLLQEAGLTPPSVMISAEDTPHGKPHPQPYLMAADRLGVPPAVCVVLEDAPAGVIAGVAAGMTVVAVTTTTPSGALRDAGAHYVLPDLAAFLEERERGAVGPSV